MEENGLSRHESQCYPHRTGWADLEYSEINVHYQMQNLLNGFDLNNFNIKLYNSLKFVLFLWPFSGEQN